MGGEEPITVTNKDSQGTPEQGIAICYAYVVRHFLLILNFWLLS